MSQHNASDPAGEQPLFQNTDEQEQVYAPQQLPGNVMPPAENDADGRSAADRGASDAPIGVIPAVPSGGVTGTGGGVGTGVPLVVPVVPTEAQVDEEERRSS